jgi:hypothetical protein
MKSANKTKKESSKFESFVREILESFIRKTDSERRVSVFGSDPLKN